MKPGSTPTKHSQKRTVAKEKARGSADIAMTELDTTVAWMRCTAFRVLAAGYDNWPCEPIRRLIQKRTQLNVVPIPQTFRGMTSGVTDAWCLQVPRPRHATATR